MNRQQNHAMAPPLAPATQCHCHRPLGLIDKAMPLSAATPPQLRQRRHFKFNGMDFETDPLSLQMASPHNNNNNKNLEDHVGDARSYAPYGDEAQESPGGVGFGTYKTLSMGARKPTLLTAADALQMEKLLLQHGPGSNNSSSNNKDQLENCSYLCGELEAHGAPWRTATQPEHDPDSSNGDGGENAAYCSEQERRVREVLAKYSRQGPLAMEENDYDDEEHLLKPSNSCCEMLQHEGYQQRHHLYSNSHQQQQQLQHGYDIEDEIQKRSHLPHRSHTSRNPRNISGYRVASNSSSGGNNNNRTGGGTVGIRDMVGNSSSGNGNGESMVGNSKMDYITLTGFLLGYLTSNVLYFLCWYFSWLKGLVINLRRQFLGQTSLWEFFDFEDTTRYSMQRKLLVAPIILVCSILYCVVNILHLLIKLVRSDVPRTVVELVQRTAKSRP